MKLCCISDLHGHLPALPDADVLVIAGDICPVENHKLYYQQWWLDTVFRKWLPDMPVVAIWGNHDWIGEHLEMVPDLPWHLLTDQSVDIDGIRFYGTPWQREFCSWAFNLTEAELAIKYAAIPGCDVLVSHGPPLGYGDNGLGSPSLTEAIRRLRIPLTICGHIHEGYGRFEDSGLTIVNASVRDEKYRVVNSPIVVEVRTAKPGATPTH